jgi:hypothetical protein
MKVHLQMMVQDPRFAPVEGAKRRIEGYRVSNEEFSDGPVTRRVAVVDLDADTGQPVPGARFIPPTPRRVLGKFDLPEPIDIASRPFNQVSVMATVLKTIALYEDAEVLGRPVRWNFDDPQLKVVPRLLPQTEVDRNAWYDRAERQLVFAYFEGLIDPSEIIYTSLSRDVVAHETGHAILDGIAPQLFDYPTFQSLALHETIGDITALLISIGSSNLRREVLAKTRGSIDNATYFSAFGEQWGMAEGNGALRNLLNDKTMSKASQEEHELSEVLTGALYKVLIKMHKKRWDAYTKSTDNAAARYSRSGKALWDSAQHFKRMTLRALDYLPPGQVTFADYARAVIAADQASYPDDAEERTWLKQEFVQRGIVPTENALEVRAPQRSFGKLDLKTLVADMAAARAFANKFHKLLKIPNGAEVNVGPPLDVTKKYYHRVKGRNKYREVLVRECLFKVSWTDPENRDRTVGTTLAIDWKTRQVRALLTSDRSDKPEEGQLLDTDPTMGARRRTTIACIKL